MLVEGILIQGYVSIGLAIYPDIGSNAKDLKHQADAAMYDAKRAGGNRVSCRPQIPGPPPASNR